VNAEISDDGPLVLRCRPPLNPLDIRQTNEINWSDAAAAFQGAASCELVQHWRKTPQALFLPATVRIAWTPSSLWLYAELQDVDIFNTATELHQQTFQLGDAFEIFLHPLSRTEYYELHVSPHNQHFQLCFTDGLKTPMNQARIPDPEFFFSRTHIDAAQNIWKVLAEIPGQKLTAKAAIDAGEEWMFSFSRYDYTRGQPKPVLSSTSRHSRPHFHDRQDWGTLIFAE
jgi:hypothetical protein